MEIERPNRRTFKKQFTLLRCSAHNNIFREIAMRSSRCVLLRIFLKLFLRSSEEPRNQYEEMERKKNPTPIIPRKSLRVHVFENFTL